MYNAEFERSIQNFANKVQDTTHKNNEVLRKKLIMINHDKTYFEKQINFILSQVFETFNFDTGKSMPIKFVINNKNKYVLLDSIINKKYDTMTNNEKDKYLHDELSEFMFDKITILAIGKEINAYIPHSGIRKVICGNFRIVYEDTYYYYEINYYSLLGYTNFLSI